MSLFPLLAALACSEPPVPPPPPAPVEASAPRNPPKVRCEPAPLPGADSASSVLRLVLSDGHSMEVGPIAGSCSPQTQPGALCAVRCDADAGSTVFKANWDGVRLAVWRRPADGDDPWARFWTETGPAVAR